MLKITNLDIELPPIPFRSNLEALQYMYSKFINFEVTYGQTEYSLKEEIRKATEKLEKLISNKEMNIKFDIVDLTNRIEELESKLNTPN